MVDFDPGHGPTPDGAASSWIVPDPLDLTFEGFTEEAFAILERLRQEPHIEQYRKEKEGIKGALTEPFKRFRDDLVVNWVLPNRLGFETEKNVFSRLLKNDFGAGGCHHHLWMAFYRPPRRRLTDVQLSHSITPEGFTTGLFVGDYASDLLEYARDRITHDPERFLAVVNPLLQNKKLCLYHSAGKGKTKAVYSDPLDTLPVELPRATGFYVRGYTCRDDVLSMQGALVGWALEQLRDLWSLYDFITTG